MCSLDGVAIDIRNIGRSFIYSILDRPSREIRVSEIYLYSGIAGPFARNRGCLLRLCQVINFFFYTGSVITCLRSSYHRSSFKDLAVDLVCVYLTDYAPINVKPHYHRYGDLHPGK